MNILQEYTLDFVRRNKRSSIAIMLAILLTTTMMSSLCGLLYTMWTDFIRLSIEKEGNWHGELFDYTYGSDLPLIENFSSVDDVMVKGQWYVGKINNDKRDYIIYRNATSEYWNHMPEKDTIIEGRRPSNVNEIALSKQYFENNPSVKIGDKITLPIGDRILNGKPLEPIAPKSKGESFKKISETTLTIVGKVDVSTSSVIPAYTALGYLDKTIIKPNDSITVYLRFKNIRDTYKELPKLAKSLGWKTNEYGKYNLKYNSNYLLKMLVFSPEQKASMSSISKFSTPIMYLTIAIFTVAVFVMVIYNAFSLSANARLTQLGILSSVGASPKQIKRSVVFEGFLLTIIPLPIGLFLGWLLCNRLIVYINSGNYHADAPEVVFTYGIPAFLPAVLLTIVTVWISALIPARKVSKISPIEAIRQGDSVKIKKSHKYSLGKIFGIEGELASNALRARKKSYRTATISLTLSFLLLTGFLHIIANQEGAKAVYGSDNYKDQRDIEVYLENSEPVESAFIEKLDNTEGVKSSLYYQKMSASTWLTEKDASKELAKNGGFKSIVSSKKYSPIERDGKFRIISNIIGLDDKSFTEYCRQISVDPKLFYDTKNPTSIVYNKEEDVNRSTRRNKVYIDYLNLSIGDNIKLNEKVYDEDKGDYTYNMKVGAITSTLPKIVDTSSKYTLMQIVPMSMVQEISKNYDEVGRLRSNRLIGLFKVNNREDIPRVREKLESICNKDYGSGDYSIEDVLESEKQDASGRKTMNLIVGFITGLLAMIGLSNVLATVSGNIRSRRQEFAMLRSVGLSPDGIKKMLVLEGLFLGITPLLLSIPVQIGIVYAFLRINEIYFIEYLPFAPISTIIGFTILILFIVIASYMTGYKQLKNENIVESIKNETI
ncbi:TPA: ABC transporter permease [Clostridioides difficile]|uniref:ABC transporter permease n=1 Tax=Clostridioides difficile TaxID=1496 RepID=UPI0008A57ED1|nr:ABC transporter permease [Clostridioides difficile]OFU08906.1 ABC transporter permease [Clostridium sp. HMSC19D07]MBG0294926.1 ABC transporter permease [Clostridioides difficile]MBH7463280.1 ABC transporter permease [Clostridioides difficile]MBH7722840.1 ABC transporter permease [Clostridioides difficile]MBY1425448.1 ABC transporter permease [Clostridioides difficile]